MTHKSVEESRLKLERRVAEFLIQADPAERRSHEASRARLLEVMKAAKSEQSSYYPEDTPESLQTRRQKAQANIKAVYRAFCEVSYEYSKIMDTLANQAPEYVSLAWGAIKIVLVVQINHEELK